MSCSIEHDICKGLAQCCTWISQRDCIKCTTERNYSLHSCSQGGCYLSCSVLGCQSMGPRFKPYTPADQDTLYIGLMLDNHFIQRNRFHSDVHGRNFLVESEEMIHKFKAKPLKFVYLIVFCLMPHKLCKLRPIKNYEIWVKKWG